MAGYAMGFDDGGAIPDDDSYDPQQDPQAAAPADPSSQPINPGAIPQNTEVSQGRRDIGPPPVLKQFAQETPGQFASELGQQVSGDIGKGVQNLKNMPMVKRILSYLSGEDGDPAAATKFEQGVRHEYPNISDDDANLVAVHKAGELGGPAAAWGMIQYNRTSYNAKQAFAKAAMNGVDGKAGDVQAAAQAATQAGAHILDGSAAQFTATPDGHITASVKPPGADARMSFKLTPQQFSQYLDVGGAGQWDRVMEQGGVPGTLQKLSTSSSPAGAAQSQNPGQGQDQNQDQGQAQQNLPTATGSDGQTVTDMTVRKPQNNYGQTPSTKDLSGGEPMAPPGVGTNYGDELEARGRARTGGWISQEPARQQWMADQEEKELERGNKVEVAAEKGKNDIERARQTGMGRVDAEKVKAEGGEKRQTIRSNSNENVANIQAQASAKKQQAQAMLKLQQMDRTSQDQASRERGRMARAEINNPNFLTQKDGDREAILKKYGIQLPGSQGTPQGAAAAPIQTSTQAPAANSPPVPGAKLYQGKWYTRGANGEAVEYTGG